VYWPESPLKATEGHLLGARANERRARSGHATRRFGGQEETANHGKRASLRVEQAADMTKCSTKRHRFRCDACDQSLDKVPLAPMLRDDVWNSVAGPQETLCADCLFKRMIRVLDRMPCFADLRPCVFNLLHAPHSWFDLVISKEKQPPVLDAEWREVLSNKQAFEKDG
jgi:hypothetical protein